MNATKNIGASVRARLLNRARADKVEFNLMLTRYALERLLYRLSTSEWSEQFLLKGALLFDLWFDQPQRPTRDIDLLGFGPAGFLHLTEVFQEICAQSCEDGIAFDSASVRAEEIRKDANYEGVRITLLGALDGARCAIQVDVGFGDAVTPEADRVAFPVVLEEMPRPLLRTYPVYTVIAEKYHAMVSLGMANTRMKDYFDLWILAGHAELDPAILQRAIEATFLRRRTQVPVGAPLGLSLQFGYDAVKRQQWKAFLGKNKLQAPALDEVIVIIRTLLMIE